MNRKENYEQTNLMYQAFLAGGLKPSHALYASVLIQLIATIAFVLTFLFFMQFKADFDAKGCSAICNNSKSFQEYTVNMEMPANSPIQVESIVYDPNFTPKDIKTEYFGSKEVEQ